MGIVMMYKVRLDAWIRGEVMEEVRVIEREQQFREGSLQSKRVEQDGKRVSV